MTFDVSWQNCNCVFELEHNCILSSLNSRYCRIFSLLMNSQREKASKGFQQTNNTHKTPQDVMYFIWSQICMMRDYVQYHFISGHQTKARWAKPPKRREATSAGRSATARNLSAFMEYKLLCTYYKNYADPVKLHTQYGPDKALQCLKFSTKSTVTIMRNTV